MKDNYEWMKCNLQYWNSMQFRRLLMLDKDYLLPPLCAMIVALLLFSEKKSRQKVWTVSAVISSVCIIKMYWYTEPGGISTTDLWQFNKFSDSVNVGDKTTSTRDPKLFYWFYLFFSSSVFSCFAATLPATSYLHYNCCPSGWFYRDTG